MHGVDYDAVVIGGGFYGCEVALELRRLGFGRVVVVEREEALLRRASYVNQARVHNGYHYPRAYATGIRSRRNFIRFSQEYREAVVDGFVKLYGIAKGSRVSGSQFASFCAAIGAPCTPASKQYRQLFDQDLIEEGFLTQEFAFDAAALARKLGRQLSEAAVEIQFGSTARIESTAASSSVAVEVNGRPRTASWVFNCTYAGLEQAGIELKSRIKKEMAEIVLIKPPIPLANVGITVMDGPYFSTMPFPALGLHSLSHVRYTPHSAAEGVLDQPGRPVRSNCEYMLRDAARYVPSLSGAQVVRSIFEVKAVLVRTEVSDARPILIERSEESPRVLSILGAKIDNIYDVREFLANQDWR
ncbi:MAG TPA: FAD-binding oxidoreductase [Allosphingosinicella sp.]